MQLFEIVLNDIKDGVDFIALVDEPAIDKKFMAFRDAARQDIEEKEKKKASKLKMSFKVQDEDKRIVLGAAMIPDLPIYRWDKDRGEYYVYFSSNTIQQIQEKFHKSGFNNNLNEMHSEELALSNSTVIYSFITSERLGISDPKGFDNPEGTWYVAAKINDDDVWQKVKSGEYRGFSVEGLFSENNPTEQKEDTLINEINSILSGGEF